MFVFTVDSAMMEGVKQFFSIGKKKPKELSDPYMTFQFAGKSVQSKVMYETYSPEFNQELKLAFKVSKSAQSLMGYNITIRLMVYATSLILLSARKDHVHWTSAHPGHLTPTDPVQTWLFCCMLAMVYPLYVSLIKGLETVLGRLLCRKGRHYSVRLEFMVIFSITVPISRREHYTTNVWLVSLFSIKDCTRIPQLACSCLEPANYIMPFVSCVS